MNESLTFTPRKHQLYSLLIAIGFFVLTTAWGLSSPPGSAGDDDFHTNSIICASGSNQFCEILETDAAGNPLRVKVPDRIGQPCIFLDSKASAACIYEQKGVAIETTRINVNHVGGLFYSVNNMFLGNDYESSIRTMRTFNAFLFSALLFLGLVFAPPRLRRGIVLMTMTVMIPTAIYQVSSINPMSWTVSGVLFSWVFLYALFSTIRRPVRLPATLAYSIGLAVSLTLTFGARKDAAMYVFVGLIANLIIFWPKFPTLVKWIFSLISVLAGVVAVVLLSGRAGNVGGLISSNFYSPSTFVTNLVELPSVIAGIIGSSIPIIKISPVMYYGLEMPFNVVLLTLTTLAGLVFTLLPGIGKRALVAIAFVIFMMIAIQMYPLTMYGLSSGAAPRLMAPLFLVAVAMFFTLVSIKRRFPSRSQGIWIFIAMPAASAIAMLTTIRRYTNGQNESWLELFFEPDWWWSDFPLDPTAVWFLGVFGSLMVAYAALRILKQPGSKVPVQSLESNTDLNAKPSLTALADSQTRPARMGSRISSRVVFALSWVFSLVSAWSLLRLSGELSPAANFFRGYFPDDQLSYAGIAASAKAANFGLVEPFTQTGMSFYPSWWYKIVGQFADWTGFGIPAAWSFLGFSVILGFVAFIGIAAFRITGRAWAPLVIGFLLWIGPLSSILYGNWYVNLDSHAVLWGPYGALYPLNAEAAGLAIGASALVLGYWTLSRPQWSRNKRLVLFGISGLGLGIIANFQTYSFLTLTAVVFWVIAVAGLLRARSRRALLVTVFSLIIVLVAGSFLRSVVGSLPIYALMLMTTLPGLWLFARQRLTIFSTGLVFYLIGASPQIIWMISGTLNEDPFLVYRVDQSGALGVPIWAFLALGSPVLVTWLAILWAQILRNGVKEIALLVGWFIAFVLLSFNNFWGFGQEPYRFWIDSVIVFTVVATLTLPSGVVAALRSNVRIGILAVLAVLLIGASMWNVGGFRQYVDEQGNIDFDSPRLVALEDLVNAQPLVPGLVTSESCIDPRTLKVVTGVPVAFYNLGLAWPDKKAEIDALIEATNAGVLDVELMRAAGVSYLVTDTGCPTQWYPGGNYGVTQLSSIEYPTDQGIQRLELWRIL